MLKYLKTSYLKVSGVFVLSFFPDVYPSLGVAVDCIPPGPSDVEDPSLGVAVDCIPPRPSDAEDPSLGMTDGGLLGRGLPSQGSLVDVERAVIIKVDDRELVVLVVGHPGSFAREEANLVELK